MVNHTRTVFYISDGTGLTVEGLAHSLLAQFDGLEYDTVTLPFINSTDQAREAVEQINAEAHRATAKPLVFWDYCARSGRSC